VDPDPFDQDIPMPARELALMVVAAHLALVDATIDRDHRRAVEEIVERTYRRLEDAGIAVPRQSDPPPAGR
jgi:hypothetical protein